MVKDNYHIPWDFFLSWRFKKWNIITNNLFLFLLLVIRFQEKQFTVYSLQFTVYSLQFTVYSLHSLQFTVYSLQFTVYSLQFTVYSLQFTVYSLQFTVCKFGIYTLSKNNYARSLYQWKCCCPVNLIYLTAGLLIVFKTTKKRIVFRFVFISF